MGAKPLYEHIRNARGALFPDPDLGAACSEEESGDSGRKWLCLLLLFMNVVWLEFVK